MSTQYNTQSKPYDELRKTTVALLERVNIREIVLPFIKDAKVLDLACGTGFYTRTFLQWGASKVVGVDISSGMLEEAGSSGTADGAISYLEADCSFPISYPGGPFDIVFGAWFLNYAKDQAGMVEMYRNISLNLKPGGRFVAVTPPPTNDPASQIERECLARPLPTASGGLYSMVTGQVEDGVEFHLHSDTPAGDLDFDTYWLRKDVWEAAAKEAGFDGKLNWSATHVPADFMESPEKYGEESNGGAGEKELATYAHVPHYGLLVITK